MKVSKTLFTYEFLNTDAFDVRSLKRKNFRMPYYDFTYYLKFGEQNSYYFRVSGPGFVNIKCPLKTFREIVCSSHRLFANKDKQDLEHFLKHLLTLKKLKSI